MEDGECPQLPLLSGWTPKAAAHRVGSAFKNVVERTSNFDLWIGENQMRCALLQPVDTKVFRLLLHREASLVVSEDPVATQHKAESLVSTVG